MLSWRRNTFPFVTPPPQSPSCEANKQLGCWWFQISPRTCKVTVMCMIIGIHCKNTQSVDYMGTSFQSPQGSVDLTATIVCHHKTVLCRPIARIYDSTESSIRNHFSHKTDVYPALRTWFGCSTLKSAILFSDKLCVHELLPGMLDKSNIICLNWEQYLWDHIGLILSMPNSGNISHWLWL